MIIKNNPQYDMADRLLFEKISSDCACVVVDGSEYKLKDTLFPTVNFNQPYVLTQEERAIVEGLKQSFMFNMKLNRHLKFLIRKGSMYLAYNANLILHGCVPMEPDGSLSSITIFGGKLYGKEAMDGYDNAVREAYQNRNNPNNETSILWYLWCGKQSPLFGKDTMRTFERYFIVETVPHKENRNAYYSFREDREKCIELLNEFGITESFSHIINGHVPVKVKDGEIPVKADGKLIVIDGGLNPAYGSVTGIAGYTLIYDSYSLEIAQHQRFESKQKIIDEGKDVLSFRTVCDQHELRLRVGDTDTGRMLKAEIELLKRLPNDNRDNV
jgi:fructose-1,6-bisphosphatase-3